MGARKIPMLDIEFRNQVISLKGCYLSHIKDSPGKSPTEQRSPHVDDNERVEIEWMPYLSLEDHHRSTCLSSRR